MTVPCCCCFLRAQRGNRGHLAKRGEHNQNHSPPLDRLTGLESLYESHTPEITHNLTPMIELETTEAPHFSSFRVFCPRQRKRTLFFRFFSVSFFFLSYGPHSKQLHGSTSASDLRTRIPASMKRRHIPSTRCLLLPPCRRDPCEGGESDDEEREQIVSEVPSLPIKS